MVSQRKILEVQSFEIETADDAGIRPKAAMDWLVYGLVAHITLVTHFVITRIIYRASANGKWNMAKQEAFLCIIKTKLQRTHLFNMHCRWTGKNK